MLHASAGILLALATPAGAPADAVKLRGKPAFERVQIVDYRGGKLSFRGLSGQTLRIPVSRVEWLAIDRLPDLGRAERAAAGDSQLDIESYQRTIEAADEPWLKDLLRARMVTALDGAADAHQATEVFLALLQRQPRLLSESRPRWMGTLSNADNSRILKALEARCQAAAPDGLLVLWLQFALLSGEDTLPDRLLGRSHRPRFGEPPPASATPADADLPAIVQPGPALTGRPLTLPPDTPVLEGARSLLASGDAPSAARVAGAGLAFVAEADSPPWRLLLARALLETGDAVRAEDVLNRLVDADPDPARRAEALYCLARANVRLGRRDLARRHFDAVIALPEASAELRQAACEAQDQLEN